ATHDISADGFYMLGLRQKQQAVFVGVRSTFYRLATLFGQGPLVVLAGAAAFVALRALGATWAPPGTHRSRGVAWFAATSFGVYLIHVWVLFALDAKGIDYRFINPWLGIPLLTLLAAGISAVLVRILQAIPFVRAIAPR
ncbi:MAG: hypothetical protein RR763_17195, partial [Massilia sp.]